MLLTAMDCTRFLGHKAPAEWGLNAGRSGSACMQYLHEDGFYTRREAECPVGWSTNSAADSGRMGVSWN